MLPGIPLVIPQNPYCATRNNWTSSRLSDYAQLISWANHAPIFYLIQTEAKRIRCSLLGRARCRHKKCTTRSDVLDIDSKDARPGRHKTLSGFASNWINCWIADDERRITETRQHATLSLDHLKSSVKFVQSTVERNKIGKQPCSGHAVQNDSEAVQS